MKHYSAISILGTVFGILVLTSCKKDAPDFKSAVNPVTNLRTATPPAITPTKFCCIIIDSSKVK
jgi:hypothetical protein